jgi:ABC-2 type transport system permease protein
MASTSALQRVEEKGWRRGFANLLSKENGAWWRTRRWLVQSVIWLLILNGIVATVLWAVPNSAPDQAQGAAGVLQQAKYIEGLMIFIIMCGIAPIIGAIIIGQDAIIDEKKSGTAAWVLSKPVSRVAFILSKLIANAFGLLITAIVVQGVIAYAQVSASAGHLLSIGGFLAALGLLFLNLLFYFTLTLMLGTLFDSRGPVLGIAFALLFGYQLFLGLAPWLAQIMPWAIVTQTNLSSTPLAVMAALEQPLVSVTPILVTAAWCVLFISVALWRFNREEF